MDKLWLLKNYRKKLAVYFALFVLLSIWIIVGIYEFSQYISQENKAKDSLISKERQIINVIDNSDIYSDVQEVTFRKILTRVFTDTILFSWGNKVISQISDFEFENFSLDMDIFQNQWWKYKTAIDSSIASANRLSKILDSLLGVVSITDSVYKKQRVDLVRYSKQIVRKHEKKYKAKSIEPIFVSYTKTNYKKINKEHYYTCFSIYIRLKNNILEIEDQWVGIDKKNQKKIFDRYFRENYSDAEWLWVWLSLVRKIVDINKWKIKLESKKDEWTKITIDFS